MVLLIVKSLFRALLRKLGILRNTDKPQTVIITTTLLLTFILCSYIFLGYHSNTRNITCQALLLLLSVFYFYLITEINSTLIFPITQACTMALFPTLISNRSINHHPLPPPLKVGCGKHYLSEWSFYRVS